MYAAAIAPRNILILEDEMLIALDIEQMLTGLGHVVVQICTRVAPALIAVQSTEIDFAILDMNVAGTLSFPVANLLQNRGVPFLFLSGYGAHGLIEGYEHAHVVAKPFSQNDLVRMMSRALETDLAR